MPQTYLLVTAGGLAAGAGLFAAVDAALLTVSEARAADLAKEGRAGARRLAEVAADRARYVSLAVLLRVACEAASTVIVAALAVERWGLIWGIVVAAAAMTVVDFVAVGVGPRTIGRQHAYEIGMLTAAVMQWLARVLTPLTRLLILLGNAITPGKGFRNGPFATEVELREVVDLAEKRGVVDAGERQMIQSVFDLSDTPAREVMVPRPEMIWIEEAKRLPQAASLAVRSGHSRIPVIGDSPDDILGVVYLKDIVQRTVAGGGRETLVTEVMRPAEFIPDSKQLDKVLADMQRLRNHMAFLVDEYGGIAGLVTMEDVLEEIVGEISDEYDSDEVPPVEDLGDGRVRVSSRLPVEDLGELFGVDVDIDDVDTVGGLLAHLLGRVPLPGSHVTWEGLRLRAEGDEDRRGRLRLTAVLVEPSTVEPANSVSETIGDAAQAEGGRA